MHAVIAGASYSLPWETLDVEDTVEERSICRLQIDDEGTGVTFRKGQPLQVVADDGTVAFAGFIERPRRAYLEASGHTVWDLACIDLHYLADKRIAARSYDDTAAGDIVRDLWERYLREEGVRVRFTPYADMVLGDGPVGYWRLGEASGTTAIAEVGPSGTYDPGAVLGRSGALVNDANTAVNASGGVAATFGDVLDVQVGSFSAEAWVRSPDVTTMGQRVLVKDDGAGGSWALSVGDPGEGRVRFFIRGSTGTILDTAAVLTAATWHHIVGTYDAATGTRRIYVDGAEVAANDAGPGGFPATAATLSVGGNATTARDIDEPAVYDRALTAAEVADHYAHGRQTAKATSPDVQDGPVVSAAVFNYAPVSACLDELAERAGVTWWIGSDLQLRFVAPGSVRAPWDPTHDDIIGEPKVDDSAPLYRNRQYVRGGLDVTDPQTEQRPGDGDTRAFTMSYPLAKVPTVTVNGAARTVGIRGVETGKDWYWNKGDPVISQDQAATPLTGADTLQVTYQGQYAVVARAESPEAVEDRRSVEETGTGLVEHVEDLAGAPGRDALFEAAKARLSKYAVIGRTVTFVTDRPGLSAGQTIVLDLPERGLDQAELLIAAVQIYDRQGQLRWRVSAVEGPVVGSWARFFGRLAAAPGQVVDLVNVGGGDVLTLLATFAERAAWSETVTQTVHACPVPSPNLFPSPELHPC